MAKGLIGAGQNAPKQFAGFTARGGGRVVGYTKKVIIRFVIDSTGSMADKIAALLLVCAEFVDLPALYNLLAVISVVSAGDLKVLGDKNEIVVSLTQDLKKVKEGLSHFPSNGGGGNGGESTFEAIQLSLSEPGNPDAIEVMILITDDGAHQDGVTVSQIQELLSSNAVLFYAVTPNFDYFKKLAFDNHGDWREIGPNSDLSMLKELFEKLAKDVSQKLNQVMLTAGGDVRSLPPGK